MSKIACWCVLVLCLAGCGGGRANLPATVRPTVTLTPLSTPLTYPATPLPVGSTENPLRWALVPADRQAAQAAQDTLETALGAALGIQVSLLLADTPAEVIDAICESAVGQVTIGSVDAVGYAIVRARKCGTATLRLQEDNRSGDEVVIVSKLTDALSNGSTYDTPFCRLGVTDTVSWVIPTLMVRAADLVEGTLGATLDRRTYADALKTVSAGGCWAAAVPASLYTRLRASNDPSVADLREVEKSPRLPLGVLMTPSQLPGDVRERLAGLLSVAAPATEATAEADATEEAATDRFDLSLLEPFTGVYSWEALTANDLAAADRFFDSTKLDFARLGQP